MRLLLAFAFDFLALVSSLCLLDLSFASLVCQLSKRFARLSIPNFQLPPELIASLFDFVSVLAINSFGFLRDQIPFANIFERFLKGP